MSLKADAFGPEIDGQVTLAAIVLEDRATEEQLVGFTELRRIRSLSLFDSDLDDVCFILTRHRAPTGTDPRWRS